MSKKLDADIIIVGGGLAGLTLTTLLAQQDFKVICIDREDLKFKSAADQRTTVISYGSQRIIERTTIWDKLLPFACPIHDIEILDGQSSVLMDFSNNDLKAEIGNDSENAFGWVIENKKLKENLSKAVQGEKNATHLISSIVKDFNIQEDRATITLENNKSYSASLIIGADGRQSTTRDYMKVETKKWAYDQTALVCMVEHEHPHNNIAIEHFQASGPFAILPLLDDKKGHHRSTLIWTQDNKNTDSAFNYSDETFKAALNARFPKKYGRITPIGKRFSYPLSFIHAKEYIKPRMALIADAAHAIHPVAGQGLNLGLRDISALVDVLTEAKKNAQDIGDIEILKKYQAIRKPDNTAMAITTDGLNKIFSNNIAPVKLLRKIGLRAMQRVKPSKRLFLRQAMGIAGTK